jgi:hypothetical protein
LNKPIAWVRFWWLLPLIFLVGLWLRLDGIRFGLPYLYHVDEPSYVVTAVRIGNRDLASQPYDPTGFANILFFEYGLYFILGKIFGVFSSLQDFLQYYETDRSNFFLISRITSALMGAVTVLIIYIVGNRLSGRFVGYLAAVFLALSFLHVRDSHYGTPDITMSFLIVLSLCLVIFVVQTSKSYFSLLAGFTGGLAVAVKWLALPVIFPLVLGSLLTHKYKRNHFINSSFGFLLGFGLGSFQIILNPFPYVGKVLLEFNRSQTIGYEGWFIDTVPGWLFYLKTLLYGIGPGILVLGALGVGFSLKLIIQKRDWLWAIVLAFFLPYLAAIILTSHFFARYILPIIPFLTLFAALAAIHITKELRKRIPQKFVANVLLSLSLIFIISQPLASSLRHNYLLDRPDTRTLAKEWIEKNIPSGAKIAVDWSVYAPPLYTGELVVPWVPYSDKTYEITAMQYDHFLHDYPLEYYKEAGFDYLIVSSFTYNLEFVLDEKDNTKNSFYTSLDNHFNLIKLFSPYNTFPEPPWVYNEVYGPATYLWHREYPGPTLKIYKIDI